jgi:hypothetical protein
MTTIDSGSEGTPGAHRKTHEVESPDQLTRRSFLTSVGATGVILRVLPVIPELDLSANLCSGCS